MGISRRWKLATSRSRKGHAAPAQPNAAEHRHRAHDIGTGSGFVIQPSASSFGLLDGMPKQKSARKALICWVLAETEGVISPNVTTKQFLFTHLKTHLPTERLLDLTRRAKAKDRSQPKSHLKPPQRPQRRKHESEVPSARQTHLCKPLPSKSEERNKAPRVRSKNLPEATPPGAVPPNLRLIHPHPLHSKSNFRSLVRAFAKHFPTHQAHADIFDWLNL